RPLTRIEHRTRPPGTGASTGPQGRSRKRRTAVAGGLNDFADRVFQDGLEDVPALALLTAGQRLGEVLKGVFTPPSRAGARSAGPPRFSPLSNSSFSHCGRTQCQPRAGIPS